MAQKADIYQGNYDPNDWVVWSLDRDGAISAVVFHGPAALDRAVKYADSNFDEFRLCDPHPRQCRCDQHNAVLDRHPQTHDATRHPAN